MLKDKWEFEYSAAKLSEAATIKKDIHMKKFIWWEQKKHEVMQKVKDTGIEIRDSVAASYSNTKGSYGPQIEINDGMQRDLSECQSKILEHNKLVEQYEGWRQVFEAQKESRLKLNHDDWLFFFGK